jgi:hypothetical protein
MSVSAKDLRLTRLLLAVKGAFLQEEEADHEPTPERAAAQSERWDLEVQMLREEDLLRLLKRAEFYAANTGVDRDLLLSDAKDRICLGRRLWRADRSLVACTCGVMRARSRFLRSKALNHQTEVLPTSGNPDAEGTIVLFERIASKAMSPEDITWWVQVRNFCEATFSKRPDCLGILERIFAGEADYKGSLTDTQYETAFRHIRRKMKGVF